MRAAYEPLFWLSHGDQRMTEWKSCASFTHCTLSHEPSGRFCRDPRGSPKAGCSGQGSKTCEAAGSADF